MPASETRQPKLGATLPAGQPPGGGVGSQQGNELLQRAPYGAQVGGVVSWQVPLWQLRLPQQLALPLPLQGEFWGEQGTGAVGPLSTPASVVFLLEPEQAASAATKTARKGRNGSA